MVIDNCLWKLCKNQRVSNVSIVTLGLWLAASVRQAAHFSSRKEVEDEGWRLSGAIDQLMVSDIPGMIHFIWWFSYFWGISKSFCHECPKRSAEQTLVPGHSHSDGQRLVFSTPRHRGFNALNVVAATWQQGTGIAFLLAFLTGPKISKDHQSQYPKPLWPISANFVGRTSLWILHFLSLNLCVAGEASRGVLDVGTSQGNRLRISMAEVELWLPSDEGIIAKPYTSCPNSIAAREISPNAAVGWDSGRVLLKEWSNRRKSHIWGW